LVLADQRGGQLVVMVSSRICDTGMQARDLDCGLLPVATALRLPADILLRLA
jgi:hypothetical protein